MTIVIERTLQNCYADNFWGEKHNGFAVMYQIMKAGQHSVKDLSEFLKERVGVEDDCHRSGGKVVKLISNFDNNSALGPVWKSLKAYYQKVSEAQQNYVARLSELSKEVNHFGDDQFKLHKSVKEKESKTFEAVNLIQTTTTCLQKAKETYHSRWTELENLKRENCSAKELSKLENRMKKAREEYRNYVTSYEKVRIDFEQRMVAATKNFHHLQTNYLEQMKQFILTYMCNVSKYYRSILTLSEDLNAEISALDMATLLANIVNSKRTGAERPAPMHFEELQAVQPSDASGSKGEGADLLAAESRCKGGNILVSSTTAANASSMTQSKTKLNLWLPGLLSTGKSAQRDGDAVEHKSLSAFKGKPSECSNSLSSEHSQQIESAAAWTNPLFDGSFTSPSANSDLSVNTTTDQEVDVNRKRMLSMGFLKKISRDRKKANHCSEASSVNVSTSSSVQATEGQGWLEWNAKPSNELEKTRTRPPSPSSSSSDSDSDELTFKKITVDIKPTCHDRMSASASVDELREAVGSMSVSQSLQAAWACDSAQARKMTTIKPGMVLRPARTGDDKWNNLSFAGMEQRLRPRSATPTHMISLEKAEYKDDYQTSSLANSRGPSPLRDQLGGGGGGCSIPLATAIIETVHALFKPNDECIVKVFGSVTLSFPFGCLEPLSKDFNAYPLQLALKNCNNIHSVVYNQKLMRSHREEGHQYEFDMASLFAHLRESADRTPGAPYFNLEIMRYEVERGAAAAVNSGRCKRELAPLLVDSSWSRTNDDVEICIRYRYNPYCQFYSPLLNVTFDTEVSGRVESVQCSPFITWSHQANRLQWKLTELSCHGRSSGVLKSVVRFDKDQKSPAPILVRFQSTEACLSSCELELLNKCYRRSLAKKRLISGKYICEPQLSCPAHSS